MINFKNIPKSEFPDILNLPPVRTMVRAYLEHCEREIERAVVKHLGYFPEDHEFISRHATMYITPDGVRHFAWLDEPQKVGEKADMSKVLVSIQPLYPR